MYADDTCVHCSGPDVNDSIRVMNRKLMLINKWMSSNGLTLNLKKCHYIIFKRKQRSLPEVLEEVFIEGVKLDKQSSTKYLGLVIDGNITWLLHVNHLTRKLSSFIPLLYNVRDSLLKDNLKLIYNSLICPLLTYGNVVWGGCCESYLGSLKVSYMCINYVYRCLLSETNQLFIPYVAVITGHDWQMLIPW